MKLDLPPPRDWQAFEDLCRDLWAELWADPNAQKHGRSGQLLRGLSLPERREQLFAGCQRPEAVGSAGSWPDRRLRGLLRSGRS